MPKPTIRTVAGVDYPDREYQQLLIQGLRAQPDDVTSSADFLSQWVCDPAYDTTEQRVKLRKKLDQMASGLKARITRAKGARFEVKKAYDSRGIDGVHEVEIKVLAFLRENGGFARRRDIMRYMHIGTSDKNEAINLDRILAKSKKVRKDFNIRDRAHEDTIPENRPAALSNVVGKHIPETRAKKQRSRLARVQGLFNLHPRELDKMVLEGRWAQRSFMIAYWGLPGAGETTAVDSGHQATEFLRNIGRVAETLREQQGMTLDEFVDRRGVMEALNAAAFRYSQRESKIKRLAGENPRKGEHADAHEMRVLIYSRFEGGHDEHGDLFRLLAHTSMRTDFYEAWAGVYSLDPVKLSRGLMSPDVSGADVVNYEEMFAGDDEDEDAESFDDLPYNDPQTEDDDDAFAVIDLGEIGLSGD